jgi:hypothetical protein
MLTQEAGPPVVLGVTGLDRLIQVLIAGVTGDRATRRDGAMVPGELDSAAQLPTGWGRRPAPVLAGCTVLGGGRHPDTAFTRARAGLFVITVNCTEPGGVCFCAYGTVLAEQTGQDGHRSSPRPAALKGHASWPGCRTGTRCPANSRSPATRSPRPGTG